MVKNPPSNSGDAGSIPDQGTKIPHVSGQLNQHAATRQLQLEKPLSHSDDSGQPKFKKEKKE